MLQALVFRCTVCAALYVQWKSTCCPARQLRLHVHNATSILLLTTCTHVLSPSFFVQPVLLHAGQGLNQALEDAWGLGAALAGAAAVGQHQLEALQHFRQQRARRMATVVGFTTSIGEASYKDGGKQEEKAMTPAEFFQFVHQVEFESLQDLQLRAAAGVAA
jgi:hypothetical protein